MKKIRRGFWWVLLGVFGSFATSVALATFGAIGGDVVEAIGAIGGAVLVSYVLI